MAMRESCGITTVLQGLSQPSQTHFLRKEKKETQASGITTDDPESMRQKCS